MTLLAHPRIDLPAATELAARRTPRHESPGPSAAADGDPQAAPRLRSENLFGNGHEIEIAHAGAVYRLRITSLGKLILTK